MKVSVNDNVIIADDSQAKDYIIIDCHSASKKPLPFLTANTWMRRLLLEEQSAIFKDLRVLDLAAFSNIPLRGGFSIVEVRLTAQSLLDPLGRPAAAQTLIRGSKFFIELREGTNEEDLSVSLYHEVLEAATVAAENPPESVMEFNEGDFEASARSAHARYGIASPTTLNEMLEKFGFNG